MLERESFREYAHKVADKMADYLENVESFAVLSKGRTSSDFQSNSVVCTKGRRINGHYFKGF